MASVPENIQNATVKNFFRAMSQVSGWFTELVTITPTSNTYYHVVTHFSNPNDPIYRFRMVNGTQQDVISGIQALSEITFARPELENSVLLGVTNGEYIQLTVEHHGDQMLITEVNRHMNPI
jgi:hypothetical protein